MAVLLPPVTRQARLPSALPLRPGMPPKAKAASAVDYSVLEKGSRLQAEFEGTYYSAEVVTVSKAKNKAKAPVKVHFIGHPEENDEWVGADRIRSKLLKA